MVERGSEQKSSNRLALVAPIVRGLLARPTGSGDIPYEPVILRSLTSKEAVEFAGSAENAEAEKYPVPLKKGTKPPLFVEDVEFGGAAEDLRKQMSDLISDYSSKHNCKPEIICLRGLGIVYVDRRDDSSDLPLKNRVAVVTGAAGAIGYGVCRGLLENGCYLAATDLGGEKLDAFSAELKRTGDDHIIGVPIDVTDKTSVAQGFESIIQTWGGIDILVLNAGIAMVSYLKEMDIESFRRLEKVNVEGAMLTLSEIARHFILQGTGGDIIVISTKNVPAPGAGFGAYSATKAACHSEY
jgi:hypothetical protein